MMMRITKGNIWNFHTQGHWVAITTNGIVKKRGRAVMGAGTALQAAERFPNLPERLGHMLSAHGNQPYAFRDIKLVTFPTKHHWRNPSRLDLIEQSAVKLMQMLPIWSVQQLFMPPPGIGLGGLDWPDVSTLLEDIFDERITIVNWLTPSSRSRNCHAHQ